MKITRIDVHACTVPPTSTALYRIDKSRPLQEQIDADTRPQYIAEVDTDEGITGLGESHRGIDPAQAMNVGCGSLPLFVRMADLADAAGIPSWHGSAQELGIRDAAFARMVCAVF